MDKLIHSKNSLIIDDENNANVNTRMNNLEEKFNEEDDNKSTDQSTVPHQIEDDKEKLLLNTNCGSISYDKSDTADTSIMNQPSSNELKDSKMDVKEDYENDKNVQRKVPTFEFDWMAYFEQQNKDNRENANNAIEPVPNHVFAHVEASLDGGVREGMIVEIPYDEKLVSRKKETVQQFWLAKVDAVYGPLLKLSYVGCNESKQEIWHDLTQKRLFPIGNRTFYFALIDFDLYMKCIQMKKSFIPLCIFLFQDIAK